MGRLDPGTQCPAACGPTVTSYAAMYTAPFGGDSSAQWGAAAAPAPGSAPPGPRLPASGRGKDGFLLLQDPRARYRAPAARICYRAPQQGTPRQLRSHPGAPARGSPQS